MLKSFELATHRLRKNKGSEQASARAFQVGSVTLKLVIYWFGAAARLHFWVRSIVRLNEIISKVPCFNQYYSLQWLIAMNLQAAGVSNLCLAALENTKPTFKLLVCTCPLSQSRLDPLQLSKIGYSGKHQEIRNVK